MGYNVAQCCSHTNEYSQGADDIGEREFALHEYAAASVQNGFVNMYTWVSPTFSLFIGFGEDSPNGRTILPMRDRGRQSEVSYTSAIHSCSPPLSTPAPRVHLLTITGMQQNARRHLRIHL